MRVEGLRACIDLVQHDRINVLLRHEYLEFESAWLSCQTTLGVSPQVLQVFRALAWDGLYSRNKCKLYGGCCLCADKCWRCKRYFGF